MIVVLALGLDENRCNAFSSYLTRKGLQDFNLVTSEEGHELNDISTVYIVFGKGLENKHVLRMDSVDELSQKIQHGDTATLEKLDRLIAKANDLAVVPQKNDVLVPQNTKEYKQFHVEEDLTSKSIDVIKDSLSLDNIKELYENYNILIYSQALDKKIFIGDQHLAPGGDVQYLTPTEFYKLYKVLETTKGTVTSIEDSKQTG